MKFANYKFLIFPLLLVTACQDFEEIEKNPNQATIVPSSLLLTGVLNDIFEEPWSLEHRWNQFWCCNFNYYGTNEYSWTNASLKYSTLKNIIKMNEEAIRSGEEELNAYSAIGKFLTAYVYVKMTLQVGDLPLSEGLQGLENIAPKYDTQKDIYLQVLAWLEEANSEMTKLIEENKFTFAGDLYLDNDLRRWQKAVNAFHLRVLVSLSNKEDDADLSIQSRFEDILADPDKYPLFESNDDNVQAFYNGTTSLYPINPGNRGFDKGRYNMAETYVDALTGLSDPRVFVTCNPAKAMLDGGASFDDFAAYVGANSGESLDDMTFKAGNGEYSFANQYRYYTTYTGPEPALLMGYSEQCFNIAEGINRGWSAGAAEYFYNEGILASMQFYGISDGSSITVRDQEDEVLGAVSVSLTDYMSQPEVDYAGDDATGLNQILTQKYIAFFQNSGLEAFYNQRRTGVPAFLTGVGTGNGNPTPKIPLRWLYPSAEETTNKENLEDALKRQFGSIVDDKNMPLWIFE